LELLDEIELSVGLSLSGLLSLFEVSSLDKLLFERLSSLYEFISSDE
jgi:hypothetical protein